jgi:hypothetical protein
MTTRTVLLLLGIAATLCCSYFYLDALGSAVHAIPKPGGQHGRLGGGPESYIISYVFHAWLELWSRSLFIPMDESDTWVLPQTTAVTVSVAMSVWYLIYLAVFSFLKLPTTVAKRSGLWAIGISVGTLILVPVPSIIFLVRLLIPPAEIKAD